MRRTLICVFVVMFFAGNVLSEQVKTVELEPIVVTPYRYGQSIYNISGSITVLTEDDLQDSNATTALDAMRVIPGINVRDYFGNNVTSSIDIRGFGEQSAMNSLVLVDGRRMNEVDQSGVDWTQIPIEQISRIEILRGGSGAVLYGDNAVSGVINIITKKGQGKFKLEADAEYGSYDMNAQKAVLSGSLDKLSYWAAASRRATHGYRDNSHFENQHASSKIEYDVTDNLSAAISAGYNNNNYGMPGALSRANIDEFGRRHTKFADDYSKNKSYYIHTSIRQGIYDATDVLLDFVYRKKDSYSNFIGAVWDPVWGGNPFVRSEIDTYGFTPRFTIDTPVFGFENKLLAGVDMYWYDNRSDTYDISDVLADYTKVKKFTTGFYFHDEISLMDRLKIAGGYRHETARYSFDDMALASPEKTRPNQRAYSIGVSYNYADFSNLFLNANRSFRFPATDEYFTWGSLDMDLKTQTSRNYEAGINHQYNEKLNIKISLFMMDLKNEIYWNPIGGSFGWGANENYDKTRRQGAEFFLDYQATKNIDIKGGYSYTKSTFREGDYKGKYVPMVPQHKVNLGTGFKVFDVLKLNINGSFTDSRYFINDQGNNFKQLGSYFTLDSNLSYSYKDVSLMFGVNNILAKKYSEYGVCNATSGAKNYYPSPGRNYIAKMSYKF
jgi:iron complex outermembrane recepter protein